MHSLQISLLPLLPLLLLLPLTTTADLPIFTQCNPTSTNYTATDFFAHNLNQVIYQLTSGGPCSGYALSSIGETTLGSDGLLTGERVTGLALCRGDVNASTCHQCLLSAGLQIQKSCPYKKKAFVYYDNCMLRYSDTVFFGVIDDYNELTLVSTVNVSTESQAEFDHEVKDLMKRVVEMAYGSLGFFGTGTVVMESGENLYGLAQCSRDLAVGDCRRCLERAAGELPGCCGGKRGGRVVGGSCNLRYELYPFFN